MSRRLAVLWAWDKPQYLSGCVVHRAKQPKRTDRQTVHSPQLLVASHRDTRRAPRSGRCRRRRSLPGGAARREGHASSRTLCTAQQCLQHIVPKIRSDASVCVCVCVCEGGGAGMIIRIDITCVVTLRALWAGLAGVVTLCRGVKAHLAGRAGIDPCGESNTNTK